MSDKGVHDFSDIIGVVTLRLMVTRVTLTAIPSGEDRNTDHAHVHVRDSMRYFDEMHQFWMHHD